MKKLFIFFVLTNSLCFSQIDSIKSDIKYFWEDTKSYFSSPKYFDHNDWVTLSSVVAGTGISFVFDKSIKDFSQDPIHRSNFLDNIFSIDSWYGTGQSGIEISGLAYLTGLAFKSDKLRDAGRLIGESAFFSAILTQTLKRLFGRMRPEYTDDKFNFGNLNFTDDQKQSFPSGHATCAFAISTVAAGMIDNTFLKIIFYAPAVITSFARIYHNRHWFSDVFLGSAIGYFTGEYLVNNYNSKDQQFKIDYSFFKINITITL